jgi:soluble lytic murein transglycosylase
MQLMPGTAREVARDLGLSHSRSRVLSDWEYNAKLGSAYLAQLVRRFDGNVIMVSAGYNAGPGRPIRWMENYGDPRQPGAGMVDWIEHIPFRETRNYVMRVAESLPVYRARLGKDPLPVPFSEELISGTLKLVSN